MTLWHPDTCGCQIEISDDQLSSNWGQSVKHIKICPAHAALGHSHADVLAENQRKNLAINDIQRVNSDAKISWLFDIDRKLLLTLSSSSAISDKTKQDLQKQLNTKYGVGKIMVM